MYFTVGLDRLYKIWKKYQCVPNVISHILLSPFVRKVKMPEDDIAFLLNRGELVEPHENEQAEVNTLVDKSRVKEFIDEQKKKSTINCTKRDLKIVYKWFVSKNELRSLEGIPAKELDALLVAFYVDVKKDNGAKYEPGSVNLISASIERHLGDAEYPHSLRNKVFDFSTRALSANKVKMKKQGKGLKPNGGT